MIYPLLPLFVVAVLGASASKLGWIEGSAQAIVAALAACAGIRIDIERPLGARPSCLDRRARCSVG